MDDYESFCQAGQVSSQSKDKHLTPVSPEDVRMDDEDRDNGEEVETVEVEERESEEDGREAKVMTGPRKPTKAEVEVHELTHIPYKSWCRHCVRGRGIHSPHHKVDRSSEEEGLPMIVCDYAFLTEKVGDVVKRLTILVLADFKTKAVLVMVVPQKGSGDGSVVKRITKWLNNLGHRKIIYKCDQENAAAEVWRKVKEDPAVECNEMVPEESAKGDSQSNGFIESSVREVKG